MVASVLFNNFTLMLGSSRFFLFIISLWCTACKKYEASEPSFVSINSINLKTNNLSEGSSSSKISDAWIYINNQWMGSYEIPCKIPLTEKGSAKISVYAGIKNTGQSALRKKYPFYTAFDSVITLKNQEIQLYPTVRYVDSLGFLWLEDFEKPTFSLVLTEGNTDHFSINKTQPFEGLFSAEIKTSATSTKALIKSNKSLSNENTGKETYLELNYACNTLVDVGVVGNINKSLQSVILLKSTNLHWNKIYIDLSNTLSSIEKKDKFEIYFQIQEFSQQENIFRMDNIKLISR